jgi:hypothetical protein
VRRTCARRSGPARSWTDHNVHDPGVTLLEALVYGLSALGVVVTGRVVLRRWRASATASWRSS